jgi:uncharacterized RDD family membrane protein YckC
MWRDELTGRLQKFRRKRARLQSGFDPNSTRDLEFDPEENDAAEELAALIDGQVIEFGDRERGFTQSSEISSQQDSVIDLVPPVPQDNGLRVLSGAAVQVGETPLGHLDARSDPVEIILESEPGKGQDTSPSAYLSVHPQGLMSQRFKAGLLDVAVLLAGGGLFAAIFWAVGPKTARISPLPINLVALTAIATLMVILYFGVSVAYSTATPGMAWMGLEVRNLDGDLPTPREAWWRAFGLLISASALFLGFVWALLDSDGLTWHDLMSGTCIVEREY